jgi:hypothetical protein
MHMARASIDINDDWILLLRVKVLRANDCGDKDFILEWLGGINEV